MVCGNLIWAPGPVGSVDHLVKFNGLSPQAVGVSGRALLNGTLQQRNKMSREVIKMCDHLSGVKKECLLWMKASLGRWVSKCGPQTSSISINRSLSEM